MKTSEVSQLFCTPGEQTLARIFNKALSNMVEPYLLREFYSWDAGPILRWDGQYKIAAKTTNDPRTEGEIKTLLFVQGTHGQILAANFMDAESGENVQRSLFIIRRRLLYLFGPASVDEIVGAYTDTCCEGLADPKKHWITKMFPNIPRAPYKDFLHGMSLVTDVPSTAGPAHALHRGFCRGVRDLVMRLDPDKENECIDHYMKVNPQIKNRAMARDTVINNTNYKQCIPNAPRENKPEIHKNLRELYQKTKNEDDSAGRKWSRKSPYNYYIKEEGKECRGTQKEVENFISHHEKGCYADPLPMEQMWYPTAPPNKSRKKDAMPEKILRKRGTNVTERTNLSANKMSEHLTRQGIDRAHQRLVLFITKYNDSVRRKIAHLPGSREPMQSNWYIQEALQDTVGEHFIYPLFETNFPKKINFDEYDEPVGKHFGEWKHWDKCQAEIQSLLSATTSSEELVQESSLPGGGGEDSTAPLLATDTEQKSARAPSSTLASSSAASATSAAGNIVGFSYGGEMWKKGLQPTPVPASMYAYTGVPDHGNLSPFQRSMMYKSMNAVRSMRGYYNVKSDVFYTEVAQYWNELHRREDQHTVGGIGGLIRSGHVKRFVHTEGLERIEAQLGIRPSLHLVTQPSTLQLPFIAVKPEYIPQQPAMLPSAKRKISDNDMADIKKINQWNARELGSILEQFNKTKRGTKDERRKRLREHLEESESKDI
jgi:hypothetical protein